MKVHPLARLAALVAAGAALVVGVPAFGDFWTFVATLAIVYALLGLSLVALTGWTGQLNLHVAALGLGWGAYAAFGLSTTGLSPFVSLVGAAVITIPFSLVIAFFAVRFRGLELAVATLAIGLTFEQLVFRNVGSWLASGSNATPFESSFVPVSRPSIGGLSFESERSFYLLSLVIGVIVYILLRNLARGGTRRAMLALRERELAAEVAGIPALRYRMGAFVLSIAVAGLAGALFASLKLGIAPDSFNLDLSFLALAGVVIGGVRTLNGGVFGGALAAVLPELVRFGPLELIAGERLLFVFGAGLVLVLALRPQGLLGARPATPIDVKARRAVAGNKVAGLSRARPARRRRGPAMLRAHGLSIHFGGVQALANVDIAVPQNEICAVIGPNGAGKTTLFNCFSGVVTPGAGRVYLDGDDLTEMPPHRRAARGLGRTFQSIELFGGSTALENVMIASNLMRRTGPVAEALGLPSGRREEHELAERARALLADLRIGHLEEARPDAMSSADLRRLELATVLVREPKVVLLDEPTAGLDPEESKAVADLIARLQAERGFTVLLVEHDMTVVGAVADWVYVLDFGSVIAQGTPADVRHNPLVIARYLGEPEKASARSA